MQNSGLPQQTQVAIENVVGGFTGQTRRFDPEADKRNLALIPDAVFAQIQFLESGKNSSTHIFQRIEEAELNYRSLPPEAQKFLSQSYRTTELLAEKARQSAVHYPQLLPFKVPTVA